MIMMHGIAEALSTGFDHYFRVDGNVGCHTINTTVHDHWKISITEYTPVPGQKFAYLVVVNHPGEGETLNKEYAKSEECQMVGDIFLAIPVLEEVE